MKVLVYGGQGDSTNAVVNSLAEEYDVSVILEEPVSRTVLLKRRIKKLGIKTVMGQVLFMLIIPPYLKHKSKARLGRIELKYGLDNKRIRPEIKTYHIDSINNISTLDITSEVKPDIVVVNGTRIISKKILEGLNVPIINMHMGITPKYRGVHGGYWAVVNSDEENCGVTIHMVDEGIDTGNIIAQKCVKTTKEDNYITYPYIQMGEGILLEKEILKKYSETKKIETYDVNLPSKLWSHPTIGQYIKSRRIKAKCVE